MDRCPCSIFRTRACALFAGLSLRFGTVFRHLTVCIEVDDDRS